MPQTSSFVIALLVLAACGAPSPSQPDPLSQQQYQARANVRVAPDAAPGGQPALVTSVVLTSRGSSPIRLTVNLQCPVVVRIFPANAGDVAPVYDEGSKVCTRAAQVIEIPPGGTREIARSVPLQELRDSGVRAGRYRVQAVVIASQAQGGPGPFTVEAGEVELP